MYLEIKPTPYNTTPAKINQMKLRLKNMTSAPNTKSMKNSTKHPPKNGEKMAPNTKKNKNALNSSILYIYHIQPSIILEKTVNNPSILSQAVWTADRFDYLFAKN